MAWLTGWQYRKKHEINGSPAGPVTDYQIRVKVHYGSGADGGEDVYLNGKCRSDFGDVRFTADDGETLLSYWMEEKVDSDYAVFWVKVPSIPASPDVASIYIYYGNPSAIYDGDPKQVFDFYDDMEGDVSHWTTTGLWHLTETDYHSPTHSFWYGQESTGNYDTGAPNSGELKTDRLPQLPSALLELYYWREVEYVKGDFDQTIIYDSVDGSTWNQLWFKSSEDPSEKAWTFLSLQLTPNAKYLKFVFDTVDASYNDYRGWFIDDIRVRKYVDPEPSHGAWYAEEEKPPSASVVELLPYVLSKAKTKTEAQGSPIGLAGSMWICYPGKRIPGYYTRLVDGIVYKGLKRLPTYEEHSPPFDIYLLALKAPPEPKRRPITEKRIPPFPRYIQVSGTVSVAKALPCVSAEAKTLVSTAEALPYVSAEAAPPPTPPPSTAEALPSVSSEAA